LLTESQVFEDEVFPGTTSADHPAQEMPEKHDHDKHFLAYGVRLVMCFVSGIFTSVVIPVVFSAQVVSAHAW
jgi:hypothetical protein